MNFDEQPVVFRLERGHVLEGRVIDDETGWPVSGVNVIAQMPGGRADQMHTRSAEAKTDRHGRFRFSNLAAGETYHLRPERGALTDHRVWQQVTQGQDGPVELRITIREHERHELQPREPQE